MGEGEKGGRMEEGGGGGRGSRHKREKTALVSI